MTKHTKTEDEVTKARRILEEDRSHRMQQCMQEIQQVLDKYGFDLTISTPSISLAPKLGNTPPTIEPPRSHGHSHDD